MCRTYILCPNIYKRINRLLELTDCKSAVVENYPYPVCISTNFEVCHGNILNKNLLCGDVVNIDVCLIYNSDVIDGCRSYTMKNRLLIPNNSYIKYNHELYKAAKDNWGSIINNIKHKHCKQYYYAHGLNGYIHTKPFISAHCKSKKIPLNTPLAFEIMYTKSRSYKKKDEYVIEGDKNVFHIEDTIIFSQDFILIPTYDITYHECVLN